MDEAEAVTYSNYPEWRKIYHVVNNHYAAMTVVADDLSKHCGLNVYADCIWVGGGCSGLGMVFTGNSIGHDLRTPEDDEKFKKLEERLVELRFVTAPKLDVLCSSSFLGHTEEPHAMARLAPTDRRQESRIIRTIGSRRKCGIIDTRRNGNGRLEKRRTERNLGEDHQVVVLFLATR